MDYTRIPFELERKFDELDEDGSLRPTIISAGNTWQKTSQASLLAKAKTNALGVPEQGTERKKVILLLAHCYWTNS